MKSTILTLSSIVVLSLFSTIACSHKSPYSAGGSTQVDTQSDEYKQAQVDAAAQLNAAFVGTVEFDRGSGSLSPDDNQKLSQIIEEAKMKGSIDEVKVVAWADQYYPSADLKKLSAAQRDLADKRASNIKNYLQDNLSVDDVDTYNMAERPNYLEEILKTSDAKVKSALETAGVSANPEVVKSKTSQAMVMVIMR